MPTLNLNPTDSYVLNNVDYTTWDKISEHPAWESNYLPITRGILLEMPPASVDPAKVTAITLKVYDAYAFNASNVIDIGFTTSVSKPSSVQKCGMNVTGNTSELTFNVSPSVNIGDVWYIYLGSENVVHALLDSVEIAYVTHTACGAPTACALNSTLATGNVTLSWSGATAGTDNAITGYEVQRCESSNGSTWGSWTALATTAATSMSVAPPTTAGNYYKYRVRTQGAAGASYYSGWKESTNTLRRDHAPLSGFTDPVLTAGTTPIKAVHMQELQNRVATLRTFYGLSAYNFTTIVAGQTSLAGWTAHVLEIRAAIDGIGKSHAAWLAITENKPRADVVQQLRDVVMSL